ncbi:MAG TPA: DNA repair protein RecN [Vicinamibacterales bacterium]|nr:DNA repair protein RecN [Vicinamibacterales bacterium]
MLRFLAIRRLAVIDSVQVEFEAGLNVLSGETGAGKSILVEAVGMLLGGRASGDLVRTGEDTATIEAIFEHSGEEWLIRREITAQGRSRAFINGELTTAGALKELAGRLIELHGQHEHQTLLDPATHLAVLDGFAGLESARAGVSTAFSALQFENNELERLRTAVADRDARLELVTYQLAELDRAALRAGEDEELDATRRILANAERVGRLCDDSYGLLYDRDGSVLAGLGAVWKRVSELATVDPVFQSYLDARDGIKSQLEDLALHLRRYADSIEASPARLQQVEDRLALLERLKRKYGPSLVEVIARRERLRMEVADLEHGTDRVTAQQDRRNRSAADYHRLASDLSRGRRRAATEFARAMEHLLGDLAMEGSRFEIRFADPLAEADWGASGIDRGEFFLSPNLGEDPRPLARIVSGGELSRVMLGLKTLSATARFEGGQTSRHPGGAAPGLIFDEVDAGIGGRVADVVGARLRQLGSTFQVLCITHLPQIAAYADTHFLIEKRVSEERTVTTVRRLDEAGRIDELSRMLGGAMVTSRLRATAAELLQTRAKGEINAKGESESPPLAKAKRQPARSARSQSES